VTDRGLPLLLSGLTGLRVAASFFTYAIGAWRFGLGAEMDLFFLAVIPLLATVNVTEAAGVGAAINFYARLPGSDPGERDRRVAGLFVSVGGVCLLLGVAFGLTAGPVAHALGGDLPPHAFDRVLRMLRVSAVGMALAPFGLIAGVGLLRARGRFLTAAALPFVPILTQVAALLTLARTAEAWLAAFVAGHALAAAAGLLASARVARPTWRVPRVHASLTFARELLPLAIAEVFLQGLYLRERQLAAALPPGSLSALVLGQRLTAVAGTIVSTGIEHTALPAIATAQFGGAEASARQRSREALSFAAVLCGVGGLLLFWWPELWITLAFRRGAFDQVAVSLTATAAAGYLGVYVFNSVGRVAIAADFARGLGWRVALTNGLMFLTYVALSAPLARSGIPGLAVAASVSFGIGTVAALAAGLSRGIHAAR
jgi:putative peptidoglycan lipid II flippase